MDIVSRLKQYMEHLQLRSSEFADRAGIPRPTLSQLLNGRKNSSEGAKKISSDIINKLHDAFPRLNVMWLLFGDGDMENDSNFEISEAQNSDKFGGFRIKNSEYESFSSLNLFDDELQDLPSEKSNTVSETQNRQFPAKQSGDSGANSNSAPLSAAQPIAFQPDKTKRVQSIMVFYSDNSFETFKPAE